MILHKPILYWDVIFSPSPSAAAWLARGQWKQMLQWAGCTGKMHMSPTSATHDTSADPMLAKRPLRSYWITCNSARREDGDRKGCRKEMTGGAKGEMANGGAGRGTWDSDQIVRN